MQAPSGSLEWLSTNRLGSFATGCADRRMRRKYHALLTVREPGHGAPWNVLAELREVVSHAGQSGVLFDPLRELDSSAELLGFEAHPEPRHRYRFVTGLSIERSLRLAPGHDQVEIRYRVQGVREPVELSLFPLLRCRPLHDLTHENPFLDCSIDWEGEEARMVPYAGMPAVAFAVHGAPVRLSQRGKWHRDISYAWEAERGYADSEDMFCPGSFTVRLTSDGDVTFVAALGHTVTPAPQVETVAPDAASAFARATSAFVYTPRSGGTKVIAGYPWFGPYARDTLIALPGLHLASEDFERSAAILDTLLAVRVDGLLPAVPEPGSTASVDASLLFVRAVQWLAEHAGEDKVARFMPAVCDVLEALAHSRDPRFRLDDGLGVWLERGPFALTWMDAMVDGEPVTPRTGFAIELDALAYNAAHFASAWAEQHRGGFARAFKYRLRDAASRFVRRFWDEQRGHLADAFDGVQQDPSLRPNQLWALALPFRAVTREMAESALTAVTRELWTPAGLRTLAPSDPRYRGGYVANVAERDAAYHQGSAFPWLLGLYADAVLNVRGREALEHALAPSLQFFVPHLEHEGCMGHVAEMFSGDAPHIPRGAPAQAWSVAELHRVQRLLGTRSQPRPAPGVAALGKKAQVLEKDMTEKLQ